MVKNKKIIIGVAVIAVLAIGGGATFALTREADKPAELSLLDGPAATDPYSTGTDTTQSEPKEQPATGAAAAGALNVASNSAINQLGQIGGNQSSQQGASAARAGSGASANSGADNPFDPTSFAQYEKHKAGTSALFGDVIKGTGDTLTEGKKAAVYYKGWLTNGSVFDQSRPGADGKVQPFVFQLGARQVIPGWEQALSGMKVGGVRLVVVPPSVGYGAAGQGSIPGNSVLVFQVELGAVQ